MNPAAELRELADAADGRGRWLETSHAPAADQSAFVKAAADELAGQAPTLARSLAECLEFLDEAAGDIERGDRDMVAASSMRALVEHVAQALS